MLLAVASVLALLQPTPVTYRTYQIDGPNQVHVTKVDLTASGLELMAVPGFDNLRAREQPGSIAKRLEGQNLQVLAIFNADFGESKPGYGGPHNSPRGLMVRDGMMLNTPSRTSTLAVPRSGRAFIDNFRTQLSLKPAHGGETQPIDFMNRWHEIPRAVLYTSDWVISEERPQNLTEVIFESPDPLRLSGEARLVVREVLQTRGGIPLPPGRFSLQMLRTSEDAARFKPGQVWTLNSETTPKADLITAISGGPRIVRGGRVDIPNADEGIPDDFVTARHPLTAYGLNREGTQAIFVVVDGRQEGYSVGVNLTELAKIMIREGAWDALNMDGGGSSTMIVGGQLRNRPSDPTGERTTTSSLAVILRPLPKKT